MQVFVKTLTGNTVTLEVTKDQTIEQVKNQLAEKTGLDQEEVRLVYGLQNLEDEHTVEEYGIPEEGTLYSLLRLLGGKKKRKKKVFTKPKRIPHKHRKNPLGVLKCYKVDSSGKVERTKKICPSEECGAGIFMGVYKTRYYCGKCGLTYKFEKAGGDAGDSQKQEKKGKKK